MIILGIDVGGSSLKGAPVDTVAGRLTQPLVSLATPQPSTPAAVAEVARELASRFKTSGPVGFGLPSVVREGRVYTAANIDASWVGTDGAQLFGTALGRRCVLLNDADAAGLAEMRLGAGRGLKGTVIVLTLGTGIGSAIFADGVLLRNTEFGHLQIGGAAAESLASGRARIKRNLDWPQWAEALNEYLAYLHGLFWPDTFILCGGVTENYREFAPLLKSSARILPGELRLEGGIVGAAVAAAESMS
ncbi:MAG TPA: ROK family protein [Steroidobacteraceae bacterium]|nr:ROK family protein [Steroidobacteraceae bacterium]